MYNYKYYIFNIAKNKHRYEEEFRSLMNKNDVTLSKYIKNRSMSGTREIDGVYRWFIFDIPFIYKLFDLSLHRLSFYYSDPCPPYCDKRYVDKKGVLMHLNYDDKLVDLYK